MRATLAVNGLSQGRTREMLVKLYSLMRQTRVFKFPIDKKRKHKVGMSLFSKKHAGSQ